MASLIRAVVRPYDSVARWGGDEYLVLAQAGDAADLEGLGERVRAAVADGCRLQGADGAPLRLTLSIGGYLARGGEDMEIMLQRADQALYAAKSAGRNCFRAWPAAARAADA